MKKIIFSISTITIVVMLVSCSGNKKQAMATLPAITVSVNQTQNTDAGNVISASGKIEAANSANISTRMMGYVTALKVSMGQRVAAGQLLATISSTDLQAKKAQTEAGVSRATAAFNSAKRDYDRFTILYAQKSASQKEMDDMTTHYEMAKAGLEAAKQMRNEVMAQFAYTNITAPFSGIISNTFVKEGDMANPGMPIVRIEGESKLEAVAMVPESEIAHIKAGMPAEVTVKSLNKTIAGKVTEVSPSASQTGGQYLVKIDLGKDGAGVLPGMYVNTSFAIENKKEATASEIMLIPQEAIVTEGQLKGVYVVGGDSTAILRWLRLGKESGDRVEVLSGLSAGEKYIISSEGRLFNGARINIK